MRRAQGAAGRARAPAGARGVGGRRPLPAVARGHA